MIYINLLPIRQLKKRQQLYQQTFILLTILVVLFVLMGMTAISMTGKAENIKEAVKELNKEKATYNRIIAQINQLKKDKQTLEDKLVAIKKLKQISQQPVRILDALASLTPSDRLWINSLRQSPTQLNISGIAQDNATIANYMDKLTESPYFSDARLGSTRLTQVGGRKLKSFSLTITIAAQKTDETPADSPKNGK